MAAACRAPAIEERHGRLEFRRVGERLGRHVAPPQPRWRRGGWRRSPRSSASRGRTRRWPRGRRRGRKRRSVKATRAVRRHTVCTAGRSAATTSAKSAANPGDSCCNVGPGTGSCCPCPRIAAAGRIDNDDAPFECCPPGAAVVHDSAAALEAVLPGRKEKAALRSATRISRRRPLLPGGEVLLAGRQAASCWPEDLCSGLLPTRAQGVPAIAGRTPTGTPLRVRRLLPTSLDPGECAAGLLSASRAAAGYARATAVAGTRAATPAAARSGSRAAADGAAGALRHRCRVTGTAERHDAGRHADSRGGECLTMPAIAAPCQRTMCRLRSGDERPTCCGMTATGLTGSDASLS